MTDDDQEAAKPTKRTYAAVSSEWRILVAQYASRFFEVPQHSFESLRRDRKRRPAIGGLHSLADFMNSLAEMGIAADELGEVVRILGAMERAGFLIGAGWDPHTPIYGQLYATTGTLPAQTEGFLWQSEVLGAELIISAYRNVTVQIGGTARRVGDLV